MTDFEDLYQRYVDPVFRFVLHRVGRRDLAEDITAEVFLSLHRNLDHIDATQLPGWLFTVGKNMITDHWRRKAVEQRYAEQIAADPTSDVGPPDPWLFENKALKPIHRTCLMLRYIHGMERDEISRRTGLTENQV